MKTTDEVLQDRHVVYGDFFEGITCEAQILEIIKGRYFDQYKLPLPPIYYLFFSKIVMKLSRLAVSPDHVDSWTDIAGYARLVELHLNKIKQGVRNAQSEQEPDATPTKNAYATKVRKQTRSSTVRKSTRKH